MIETNGKTPLKHDMWAGILTSGQIIYSHQELPNIHLKKLSVKTMGI